MTPEERTRLARWPISKLVEEIERLQDENHRMIMNEQAQNSAEANAERRQARQDVANKIKQLESELISAHTRCESFMTLASQRAVELEEREQEIERLQHELDKLPKTIAGWNMSITQCERLESEIKRLQHELTGVVAERDWEKARADRLQSEVETLQFGVKFADKLREMGFDERLLEEYRNQKMRIRVLESELVSFKKLCPACHGDGYFHDSTEGGIPVTCDCPSNIRKKLSLSV